MHTRPDQILTGSQLTIVADKHHTRLWIEHLLQKHSTSVDDATDFLRHSQNYDSSKGRWTVGEASVSATYGCPQAQFCKIINDILRNLTYTKCINFAAVTSMKETMADISILGCGHKIFPPYPKQPTNGQHSLPSEAIFHRYVLAPIMLINVSEMGSNVQVLKACSELGSAAKTTFYHQANRHSMYGLILSSEEARLVLYDRSGTMISSELDVHNDAATFVRLIAALGSRNFSLAGFDESIFYSTSGVRYMKSIDEHGHPTLYELLELVHNNRGEVAGSASSCWIGRPVGGTDKVAIKEYWRSSGSDTDEITFLLKAKNVEGFATVVAVEHGVNRELSTLRQRSSNSAVRRYIDGFLPFDNRFFTRVIMEASGEKIYRFKDGLQLLCALRDAVQGHYNLYRKGIVHGNISPDNILLGQDGAAVGSRGVLIDLDHAKHVSRGRTHEVIWHENTQGTPTFYSMNTLAAKLYTAAPPHDYLDDLEAFLYVYLWIVMTIKGPNHEDEQIITPESLPPLLKAWKLEEGGNSAKLLHSMRRKEMLILNGLQHTDMLTACFSRTPVYRTLANSLQRCLKRAVEERMDGADYQRDTKDYNVIADDVYEEFLGAFDTAIQNVKMRNGLSVYSRRSSRMNSNFVH